MSVSRLPRVAGLLALVLVACALPFVLSNFRLFQFSQVYIYAIAILGLNMLTGYNGQFSLGHGAFYAILILAVIMYVQTLYHIPEVITGLGGATLIGISLWSSIRHNRKEAAEGLAHGHHAKSVEA